MRSFAGRLGLVTAVAFAGRMVFTLATKGSDTDLFDEGDAFFYGAVASKLGDGGFFVFPFTGAAAADHPPLTVLVLGPASWLFDGSILSQRLTMTVIGAGAVAMVGLAGRAAGGDRVGLAAAAVAAVNPNLWVNDALVMAEAPTAVLVAGVLAAGWRFAAAPSLRWALVLGGLGGLGVLARAETGLVVVGLAAVLLLRRSVSDHELDVGDRLRRGAVVLGAMAVVIAPWTIWLNTGADLDRPVLLSTNDGTVLRGAYCDETFNGPATGFWSNRCVLDDTDPNVDPSVNAGRQRDAAVTYLGDHLGDLPRVVAIRELRVWGVYRPAQMVYANQGEGRPEWASWAAIVGWWVMAPLLLAGTWLLYRRGTTIAPLVVPVLTVALVAAAFYGIVRFRLPVDVAASVAAGVVLAELSTFRVGDRRRGR